MIETQFASVKLRLGASMACIDESIPGCDLQRFEFQTGGVERRVGGVRIRGRVTEDTAVGSRSRSCGAFFKFARGLGGPSIADAANMENYVCVAHDCVVRCGG